MTLATLMIPASRLSFLEQPWDGPLAILDPTAGAASQGDIRLPPCPVLALGEPDAELVDHVDVFVGTQRELETLANHILAHPSAAAACVQALRIGEKLDMANALPVESLAYAMLQGSGDHLRWQQERSRGPHSPPGRVDVTCGDGLIDLVLNRPWAGNAIDRAMRDELAWALCLGALDPDVRCIRLRANGKAFSLGADLEEFGTTPDPAAAHAIRALTLPAHAAIGCAHKLEVWVDGACIGAGLELAAFAARVIATPRSWFQLPELAMGIIPGAGGCVSVPRRIGRHRAALMMLSGRRIGARQALAWGLIDAVVDHLPADEGGGDIRGP